jgi:hypothetical protein
MNCVVRFGLGGESEYAATRTQTRSIGYAIAMAFCIWSAAAAEAAELTYSRTSGVTCQHSLAEKPREPRCKGPAGYATLILVAGHSISDTATIYQDWMGRRIEMFAEDSGRLFADSQEFVKAGARLLSNGSGGGST